MSSGLSDLRAEDESVSDIRLVRAGQDKIVTRKTTFYCQAMPDLQLRHHLYKSVQKQIYNEE